MAENRVHGHDPTKSSRFITGGVLLVGLVMLGTAIGLAFGTPGLGVQIGLAVWLVTISLIRAARGL